MWEFPARIEYETTAITLKELAKKNGKSLSLLQKVASKNKWDKQLKKINKEVEQIIEQSKAETALKIKKDYSDQVNRITGMALDRLELKIKSNECDIQDIKAALDISGLKKETLSANVSGEMKKSLVKFVD